MESVVDAELRRRLDAGGVSYCVVGATALAVHGYVRTTGDVDLLTMDERILTEEFWGGASVKIRRGAWDDPLAGSVVWKSAIQHDVIAGRGYAAQFALQSAADNERLGCRVATPLGLVLMKLEAGSAQDLYDVLALMERRRLIDGAPWVPEIARHLPQLSAGARDAWTRLQSLTKQG